MRRVRIGEAIGLVLVAVLESGSYDKYATSGQDASLESVDNVDAGRECV